MKFKTPVLSTLAAMMLAAPIMAQNTQDENTSTVNYGKNVIALAPMSFTEVSKGIGLSYEKALDKEGILALWIPVSFGFRTYNDYYYNNSYNSSTVYGNFYVMPSLKIYPTGSFAKCKYSIGPSLIFASGSKPQNYNNYYYYPPTPPPDYKTVNFLKMGFSVTNSLNINPIEHLYLGLDFGFGITYVNTEDNVNMGTNGLVYFAFRVGYRY